jgi:NADH-quinone oxidoreductase subunit N
MLAANATGRIDVDWSAIAPELVLLGCACAILVVAIFLPQLFARVASAGVAAGGFVAAAIVSATQWNDGAHYAFDHTLRIDDFGQAGRLIVYAAGFLAVLVTWGSPLLRDRAVECYALMLAAAGGMSLLAVSNSFVTLFVALELFSICLYILVALDVDDLGSLEGGLKYLVVGAVGAALLLYGAALVYGGTGALEFDRVANAVSNGDNRDPLLLSGLGLILVGLAFKSNSAPFHMWTPDAYQGAPTSITTFMSAATKAVALVATLRVLTAAFPQEDALWQTVLAALAIASFVVGNLAAIRQSDVKRMLAYSTIGHTGFLFTAVAAHTVLGTQALIYYLAAYAATNISAFAVVAVREREVGRRVEIDDFRGYAYRRPWLSAAMIVSLLSLAGIPPTAGFLGKLTVFSAAVDADLTYLAIAGVIATMVALVYYIRIPFAMLDRDARVPIVRNRSGLALSSLAAGASALAVIILFVVPGPLLDAAKTAGKSLLGG